MDAGKEMDGGDPTPRGEKAIATHRGVSARMTVLSAAELAAAVTDNPLQQLADDPSRLLGAVLTHPTDRRAI
jgi:hypothetical protein